jgi:hypothetical protein
MTHCPPLNKMDRQIVGSREERVSFSLSGASAVMAQWLKVGQRLLPLCVTRRQS